MWRAGAGRGRREERGGEGREEREEREEREQVSYSSVEISYNDNN